MGISGGVKCVGTIQKLVRLCDFVCENSLIWLARRMDAQFEDMVYLRQVHRQLQDHEECGGASVLVGAGFSKNAILPSGSRLRFPSWGELMQKMIERLGTTSQTDSLQIAQEFEEKFGRAELDRFLKKEIPDKQAEPGEHHLRLLELPWKTVLTTNYDTLLERSIPLLTDGRFYEPVTAVQDIPGNTFPRIVKLHGTFPDKRPFTITQRDFDTYENRFAPFVNLVRQAAMETALVLIGFSANDPNFKRWTKWVQKRLAAHAPLVFMCGVLDKTPEEKAELQREFNIRTIDIGPLYPASKYSHEERHRIGTLELLNTLQQPHKPKRKSWPSNDHKMPQAHKIGGLPQIPNLSEHWPEAPELCPVPNLRFPILPDGFKNALASQEKTYPGWIIAPREVRDRMFYFNETNCILKGNSTKDADIWTKILLLDAANWRKEIALDPLDQKEASLIEGILNASEEHEIPESRRSEILRAKGRLGLAILRMYREDNIQEKYDFWCMRMSSWTKNEKRLQTEQDWEHSQRLLCIGHLVTLNKHLDEWMQRETSPWGKVRIASMYAEIGNFSSAKLAGKEAMISLAKECEASRNDFGLLTKLAWAREAERMISMRTLKDVFEAPKLSGPLAKRMKEEDCSPMELFQQLQNDLLITTLEKPMGESRELGFDSGTITTSCHMGRDEKSIAVLRFLRFLDVSGLPLVTAQTRVGGKVKETLTSAFGVAPFWILNVLMRTYSSDTDKDINKLFNRGFVYSLDQQNVDTIYSVIYKAAENAIEILCDTASSEKPHIIPVRYLKSFVDIGSRLLFRLDEQKQAEAFSLLIIILRNPKLSAIIGQKLIEPFIRRAIESINPAIIATHITELLEIPIKCVEEANQHDFIDVWSTLSDDEEKLIAVLQSASTDIFQHYIPELLDKASSQNKSIRSQAILRLLFMKEAKILDGKNCNKFHNAVLSQLDSVTGLPTNTSIHQAYLADNIDLPPADVWNGMKNIITMNSIPEIGEMKGTQFSFSLDTPVKVGGLFANLSRAFTKANGLSDRFSPEQIKEHLSWFIGWLKRNRAIFKKNFLNPLQAHDDYLASKTVNYISCVLIPAWYESHANTPFPQEHLEVIQSIFGQKLVFEAEIAVRSEVKQFEIGKLTFGLKSEASEEVADAIFAALRLIDGASEKNNTLLVNQVAHLLLNRSIWCTHPELAFTLDSIRYLLETHPEHLDDPFWTVTTALLLTLKTRYANPKRVLKQDAEVDELLLLARSVAIAKAYSLAAQQTGRPVPAVVDGWRQFSAGCCLPEAKW